MSHTEIVSANDSSAFSNEVGPLVPFFFSRLNAFGGDLDDRCFGTPGTHRCQRRRKLGGRHHLLGIAGIRRPPSVGFEILFVVEFDMLAWPLLDDWRRAIRNW
jgi:hypothetical protein